VWLIHFLLENVPAFRRRRCARLPSWWVHRPDMAPGSTQELAASVCGPFGNAIALMCRHWGFGPGHKDWPYLSRMILAFGGSLHGVDGRKHPQPWWETPEVVPGMIRADAATKPSAASLLAAQIAADSRSPVPSAQATCAALARTAPARAAPAHAEPAVSRAFWWLVFARAGTGPPTGPPVVRDDRFRHRQLSDACQFCYV
jgi:hypothetical protein